MFEPEKKYLSIKEVSQRTEVPSYTLRYWEKEFKQLKPERYSGQRKYSSLDVELVKKIKDLLYNKRYTIEGVKKYLKVDRRKKISNNIEIEEKQKNSSIVDTKIIDDIKKELEEILEILN